MRKIVFLLFLVTLFFVFCSKKEEILIPDESIRIRVVANSDSLDDQKLKSDIKNEVSQLLYRDLKSVNNYQAAKTVISSNINNIKNVLSKYTDDYEISYGKNYFPEKEYKGVKYKEGNYESILITLGEGKGKNFWCLLFPPLCMIDEEKLDNVTYSLFVSELLNKIK